MRGQGVKKCLFLSTLRVYKLSTKGGGLKVAKFCPRSCGMPPNSKNKTIEQTKDIKTAPPGLANPIKTGYP